MALKVTTDEVRRTVRTVLAVVVTLAALVPVGVELGILDEQRWPWVGLIVAGAAAVTRVMQTPAFDELLRKLGVPSLTRDGARVVQGEVVDPAPAEEPWTGSTATQAVGWSTATTATGSTWPTGPQDLDPDGSVRPSRLE